MSTRQHLWTQTAYLKAYRFAAEAHNDQLYPGTDIPYLMHLSFVTMEVMTGLAHEQHVQPDLAVQCALLHDVIEDTAVTYPDVAREFGTTVAQGVQALTKDAALPKASAMADSLNRIQAQPTEIWLVKLADRITNLAPPPHYWTPAKINAYRTEAQTIYTALHTASPFLGMRLAQRIDAYQRYC